MGQYMAKSCLGYEQKVAHPEHIWVDEKAYACLGYTPPLHKLCGFCDGDHLPQDCAQLKTTVREYNDA